MGTVLGLMLGAGLFSIWWSWWPREEARAPRPRAWVSRTQDLLVRAGAPGLRPGGLVGLAVGSGVLGWLVTTGFTGSAVIGLCFGAMAARAPFALVHMRARAKLASMREVWPEAVDHLASGVRAGLALPEAIVQLGARGPEALRPAFTEFAHDYRSSGRFSDCLDLLKARLADPVGDRIIETLRVTREVGGSDLGRVLRSLSAFLRDDARTRGELEARQSWTVNAARLAVVAPWAVLLLLSSRQETADAYNTPAGATVLTIGAVATVVAYRVMVAVGRLPQEARVLR